MKTIEQGLDVVQTTMKGNRNPSVRWPAEQEFAFF